MRIAVVSPARDMCHTAYAHDLASMMAYTASVRPDISLGNYIMLGTMIFDQRIKLAREAVQDGSDYVLWFDTDMRFPKDTLLRLLAHGKDFVAANYVTRQIPPEPISFTLVDDGRKWARVPTTKTSTGLEKVSGTGLGVALTSTKMIKAVDDGNSPMFWFQYSIVNHTTLGEDIYFCIKCTHAGYDIFIDHDLSKEVRHVGMLEFCHDHVDDDVAAMMRKELDAAVVTDLNKVVPLKPPAPVIPLANGKGRLPSVAGNGIHKDIITQELGPPPPTDTPFAAAQKEKAKNVAAIVGEG